MIQILPEHIETEIAAPAVMGIAPVVSVNILTYNHAPYLSEAIESVVAQQADFPFEIIIGEDCSTDNTRAIALEYQQRYPNLIRVVYWEHNIGVFNNANRCFAKVRGEFMAYCEGDDYWNDPYKLQKQVDFLRANPDYGLVHSDYDYLVYNFGKWRLICAMCRPKRKAIHQGKVFENLLSDMFIRTCTMVARTSLVAQHFNSKFRNAAYRVGDRPLVLHMSLLGDVGYIDEPLATYRRTPGSMINSGYAGLVSMQRSLFSIQNDFISAFGYSNLDLAKIRKRYYKTLASFAFRANIQKDFEAAVIWLEKNAKEIGGSTNVKVMKYLMRNKKAWLLVAKLRDALRELDLYRRALFSLLKS